MSQHQPTKTILYEKRVEGSTIRCQVEVYPDGSAYVTGDELEVLFEGSTEAIRSAIEYVESREYVKASSEGP